MATEPCDLRKTLSQNMRALRSSLHISQAKLAESAGLSLSYLTDIERCKTWVSDKTLTSLAKAFNIEAYQLLVPIKNGILENPQGENQTSRMVAELINIKKNLLRQKTGEIMDDLLLEIISII